MHAPVRVERIGLLGRMLREPLVHFLLIGLLLFALYGAVGGGRTDRNIRVDDNVAAALYTQFAKTWQRPPTAQELRTLVESYVRDEIFYREGVELGFDKDDPTIKRRVGQKFATIAEESRPASPPTDAELERWLMRHSDRYAAPSLVTFDQIGFGSSKDGLAELQSARKALAGGADPQELGDERMMLPHFELYPIDLVQRDFGPDFARSLLATRKGQWVGPVKSGYGLHLVRVEKVVSGRVPKLAELRAAVARDYEQARRTKSLDSEYGKLRQSYRIELSGKWIRAASQ